MNIKDIFDKATSENKSLTFDEFEALAKDGKAKFADLSEGRYVDRQKYSDDLAKKDTEISSLNDTLTQRSADISDLQEKLNDAGVDENKLKELTDAITGLQAKYDADTKSLQDKLAAQSYEFAVRDFAGGQSFSSKAARKEFERQMIQKNLPMENGKIMGATDWLKEYMKENKDSFIEPKQAPTEAPKPQFADTATGKKEGSKMTLSEMMAKKNEDPNFVVTF